MIGLSAPTYDPNGHLILPTGISNPYGASRRGDVTATLDGGVSVYDGGYSIADTTLSATLQRPTKAQLIALQYLIAYYPEINVCCEPGAFAARLSFSLSKSSLTLSMRLIRRLDV
jgi:hypothetical protein